MAARNPLAVRASIRSLIPHAVRAAGFRAPCLRPSSKRPNAHNGFLQVVKPLTTHPGLKYSSSSAHYSTTTSDTQSFSKTPLYDLHVHHGGKMVPFGGFLMPVQYDDQSIGESHHWTREKASLFDVSHMVQHRFSGPGAESLLMKLTPSSLSTLPDHQSTLSCFLLPETGGIVDDTVITRLGPENFYVVTNAACREKDLAYLEDNIQTWNGKHPDRQVDHEVLEGWGLIALQGPLSGEIFAAVISDPHEADLKEFYFGQSKFLKLKLPNGDITPLVLASRGGYTGEDGFEISVPPDQTTLIVDLLLGSAGPDKLRLAGLGARDSLRLEAGMCLYGHDLDETTTPVEAGLSWVVAKDRRQPGEFNGAEVIVKQITPKKDGGTGVSRRRIGLIIDGAPAREGAEIQDADGNAVGRITSGCPSPTLKKNIAMGYVKQGLNKTGTELQVLVRNKARKAVVTKMPFVPSKYWKGGATPG